MATRINADQILDSIITAVVVLNEGLCITYLNASAEMLLSLSREHALGKPLNECFSEVDGTPKLLSKALAENSQFTQRKARWVLQNHQETTVDYSVTPNPEAGSIIIEIQPQDRLLKINREEAWLSSQETSRNFIRSIAHEIKNPLGGIRGAAQLLAKELVNQNLEDYTGIIIEETDRLRNLVDRMLGPSRPMVRELVNIHEVLEYVSSVIKLEVGEGISIERDYDPSIPELCGDKEQLIQAILNIGRNAMQALSENKQQQNGQITFSTRILRRYTLGREHYPLVARITIRDNGPGIPPDIIDDIFFPMITGRPEGTGLGLAISQNLIGQHHGLIECESEAEFTEFALYLPLGISP